MFVNNLLSNTGILLIQDKGDLRIDAGSSSSIISLASRETNYLYISYTKEYIFMVAVIVVI